MTSSNKVVWKAYSIHKNAQITLIIEVNLGRFDPKIGFCCWLPVSAISNVPVALLDGLPEYRWCFLQAGEKQGYLKATLADL